MSEVVHYKGTLTPINIPDFKTLEEEYIYLQDKGFKFDDIYEGGYLSYDVIKLDGKWYAIDYTPVDMEEEIINVERFYEGFTFDCKFYYDGGSFFKEVIQKGYDKLKSNI